MLNIVQAIYDMMGKYSEPTVEDISPVEHVERVFQVSSSFTVIDLKIKPRIQLPIGAKNFKQFSILSYNVGCNSLENHFKIS